eukprot:scaffold1504_cov417-Prasinococcus_capsulatus_cf.AAC.30
MFRGCPLAPLLLVPPRKAKGSRVEMVVTDLRLQCAWRVNFSHHGGILFNDTMTCITEGGAYGVELYVVNLGTRTHDHEVKSLALYRLSYPGTVPLEGKRAPRRLYTVVQPAVPAAALHQALAALASAA